MKNRVLIIGCGFAGLSAARVLSRLKKDAQTIVIDRGLSFNFLPMLPDVMGRNINPDFLDYPIADLGKRFGFEFINAEVQALDLEKRAVVTEKGNFAYDYLIIASGSETNFYGNADIKRYAYKLDDADDARIMRKALADKGFSAYVVGGGGYTGVEIATNLRIYLNKHAKDAKIIIVERAPSILGPLPQWMKDYVRRNLERLDVEILVDTVINRIEEDKIWLSNGESFARAMLIWAAGVVTAGFLQNLKAEKNPQGRVKVDSYLRLDERCWLAGDVSYVASGYNFLRMAVQFAITQGECAAINVIKSIKGKKLTPYKPVDLGYIIPMANNRSCGRVLGLDLKGCPPTIFHFLMCIYRSYGLRNKWGLIRDLLKGG